MSEEQKESKIIEEIQSQRDSAENKRETTNASCAKFQHQLYKDETKQQNPGNSELVRNAESYLPVVNRPNDNEIPNGAALLRNYRIASSHGSFDSGRKRPSTAVEKHQYDATMKDERPPRRVTSGKPHFVDFSSFKSNTDYEVLFDNSKTTQNIIETLRDSKVYDNWDNIATVPVDWLGVPLNFSSLPDFLSTTKLHFRKPDQSNIKEISAKETKPTHERNLYDQFVNVSWVPRDLTPQGIGNGHGGKHGVMATIIPHPKSTIWNVPEIVVRRIKKSDPMEYLNLLDPKNIIPTDRAMYQWLTKDDAGIGHDVTVGESVRSSGFTTNYLPHLPPIEERDFHSVYRKSYCIRPPRNDVEGLAEPLNQFLTYPGYQGGSSMRDVPSSFMRFGPNEVKTKPNFLDRKKSLYRRAMSAKPVP